MLVPVILSGGAGTRLWPLSRRAYPKPFLRLPDGENLLGKTLLRALRVADLNAPIVTVTAHDYQFITRDEYQYTALNDAHRCINLLEPSARNTAPAVILAAFEIQARIGNEAILLVLAADHLIADLTAFENAVNVAKKLAEQNRLVTFGIVPTRAETGYGYIQRGNALDELGYEVKKFVEKPSLQVAEQYLQAGDYLWNSGMFCFRVDAFLDAAKMTCPDVYQAARLCFEARRAQQDQVEYDRELFAGIPEISIDYAVMERAESVAVVPASFDWNDIGSFNALHDIAPCDADGNHVQGQAVLIDSRHCFVQSEKLVATIGLDEIMVIDTRDAVLVAPRSRAQDVKKVVDQLRLQKHESVEHHLTVHRPWGSYTVLEDAPDCKVKRLVVKPGQILSLQLHHQRSEHWTVVQGTAKIRVGDLETHLKRNQSIYIPMGTVHRLENDTAENIALIEVQCGDYFGEDDIVRLEDRYGRLSK